MTHEALRAGSGAITVGAPPATALDTRIDERAINVDSLLPRDFGGECCKRSIPGQSRASGICFLDSHWSDRRLRRHMACGAAPSAANLDDQYQRPGLPAGVGDHRLAGAGRGVEPAARPTSLPPPFLLAPALLSLRFQYNCSQALVHARLRSSASDVGTSPITSRLILDARLTPRYSV